MKGFTAESQRKSTRPNRTEAQQLGCVTSQAREVFRTYGSDGTGCPWPTGESDCVSGLQDKLAAPAVIEILQGGRPGQEEVVLRRMPSDYQSATNTRLE